jgi:AcrR family transcriptional regulator
MGRPKLIEDAKLLEIARQVFREHGHTAKTRHVAKAAGISEAALFKRFKTKNALFYAALNNSFGDLAALTNLDPTLAPRTYLVRFTARAKDHFRQALPSILSVAAHPKYGKEMMGQVHRYNRAGEVAALLRLRLEAWQKTGEIRAVRVTTFANIVLHTLHSMAMVELISGEPDKPTPEAEMEPIVETLWEIIRPLTAPKRSRS